MAKSRTYIAFRTVLVILAVEGLLTSVGGVSQCSAAIAAKSVGNVPSKDGSSFTMCGYPTLHSVIAVKKQVEAYFHHSLVCARSGTFGEAQVINGIPTILLPPGMASELGEVRAAHELMHLELATEGFEVGAKCPVRVDGQMSPPTVQIQDCIAIWANIEHRIFAPKLRKLGIDERQFAAQSAEESIHELDRDYEIRRKRGEKTRIEYIDNCAVILLEAETRAPIEALELQQDYLDKHLDRAVDLASRLNSLLNRERPRTSAEATRCFNECIALIFGGSSPQGRPQQVTLD